MTEANEHDEAVVETAADETVAVEETAPVEETAAEPAEPAAAETPAEEAPVEEEPAQVDPARQAELDALAAELQGAAPEKKPAAKRSRRVKVEKPAEFEPTVAPAEETPAAEAAPAAEQVEETVAPADAVAAEPAEPAEGEDAAGEAEDAAEEGAEGESRRSRSRRGRNRNRSRSGGDEPGEPQAGQQAPAAEEGAQEGGRTAAARNDRSKRGRGQSRHDDELEPEILPDDVLIPIAGILDVLDNYAFVRTTGYLPGVTDVYVSLGQVKKYGLRKGDAVVGAIRQPREGEQQGRQKYNALVRVDSVNGQTAEQSLARPDFAAGVPITATEQLVKAAGVTVAKGARVLVQGGTAQTVAALAEGISKASPETHVMAILVNPRPEEATELKRAVKGEVVVTTLDQGAEDHITVVELAVERAKRLVELGIEVAILLDSATQLGRAYFAAAPVTRAHADDPSFAIPAKRLFVAGRRLEDAAALTVVATVNGHTAIDQLLANELASLANAVVTA